jgi:predicted ATP-grasp superfamily ATP-dependent carboligase
MQRLSKWALTVFNYCRRNRQDGVFCVTSVELLSITFEQEGKVIRKAIQELEHTGFAEFTYIDDSRNEVKVYINEE